jgi:putative ABC transport system substrate-binding protein
MLGIRRREFITLIGGAVAWPVAVRAQQVVPVLGYLSSESPASSAVRLAAFHQGLKGAGFIEGQNLAVEYRWAEGRIDRLPALASDLIQRRVSAIFAFGPAAPVAKAATRTIPIVFEVGSDPVAIGLVAALNRPGGNLTGVTTLGTELGPKRLELLHDLVPKASTIAALLNPRNTAADEQLKSIQSAVRTLGLTLHVLKASTGREIENSFASLKELRADALLIGNDGFFTNQSQRLAALASQHAVPTMFQTREFVAEGGLMSYGDVHFGQDRQAGSYVGQILNGKKATDLPVVQPTKFNLVINLKTARALGLDVSQDMLSIADEVIE